MNNLSLDISNNLNIGILTLANRQQLLQYPVTMATRDIVIDRDLLQVLDCIDSIRDEALQLLHQQEQLHLDIKNIHNLPDNTIQNSKSQSRLVSKGSQLRGLYRRAIMSTRTTKQTTSQARAEVDNLYLQLQNITYEQTHLKGEISACEGYP